MNLIQTPPLSTLDQSRQPVSAMIDEVASVVGRRDDPDARVRALAFLDRAADRLNMAGVLFYRKKEHEYEASALTSGQATLELPTDWGWPCDGAFLYDENGGNQGQLFWLPFEMFRRYLPSDPGTPTYLSIRSEFDGIHVCPTIDPTTFTTLRVSYFARIQRVSEAEEIYLTPETREALITGAQFLWAQRRYQQKPSVWQALQTDFNTTVIAAIAASKRREAAIHLTIAPDLDGNTMPGITDVTTPRPAYIKIGD